MPGVARNAGRDAAGGRDIQGSPNVMVNGSPAVRVGDRIQGHGKPPHSGPVMVQGSSTVYVNGKKLCRAGDRASCGHSTTGSGNVSAG